MVLLQMVLCAEALPLSTLTWRRATRKCSRSRRRLSFRSSRVRTCSTTVPSPPSLTHSAVSRLLCESSRGLSRLLRSPHRSWSLVGALPVQMRSGASGGSVHDERSGDPNFRDPADVIFFSSLIPTLSVVILDNSISGTK